MVVGHWNATGRLAWALCVALIGVNLLSSEALAQEEETKPQSPSSDGVYWLEEPAEVPYVLAGQFHKSNKGLDVTLHMAGGEKGTDGLALEISQGKARFLRISDGKASPLGVPGDISFLGDEPVSFSLHRTSWQLDLLCSGRVVCQAWSYAPAATVERVGWQGGEGQVEDLRVQPVGSIYKADSFMRIETGEGEWEPGRGQWRQRALREDQQADTMDATKTTNPFSYFGEVKGDEAPAVSTLGYWFWTDYRVSASVRGGQDSVIGLVVCYQDADNYLGVRWSSAVAAQEPHTLKLVAVEGGQEKVLAQTRAGFLPDQWYRLSLGYSGGKLVCWVDGRKRLAADTILFGEGVAGLLADGAEGIFFDDVLVEDWEVVYDDFSAPAPGKWIAQGGDWQVTGGVIKVTSGGGEALVVTGRPEWANYSAGVAVKVNSGGAGIVVGAGETTQVAAMLQRTGKTDRLAILRKLGQQGHWEELVAVPVSAAASANNGWRRLEIDVEDGYIKASCDGVTARAFVPGVGKGRVGLVSPPASSAAFDNFSLNFIPPPPTSHLVKEFTDVQQHFEMAEWASTRHAWVPVAQELGVPEADNPKYEGQWVTKGDFHGDYSVQIPLADIGAKDFIMTVVLDAEPGWQGTGVGVQIQGKQGQKVLTFTVTSGEEKVTQQQVEVTEPTASVTCRRKSEFVAIAVDGKVIYSGKLLPPEGTTVLAQPAQTGESK